MPSQLDLARKRVLEWLREEHREPAYLNGAMDAVREFCDAEVAQQFLERARSAGFAYDVIPVQKEDGHVLYVLHWTHHGANFVGFKQPLPEATVADALLAGCAALLENQWCLKWLRE